jgi:hypothetical protein
MNIDALVDTLRDVSTSDSRELDRVCERAAAQLHGARLAPPFDITSADLAGDPLVICADRYWRLRFLEEPTVATAVECARWVTQRVASEHQAALRDRWPLGYAFITRDTVDSARELDDATQRIVASSDAADVALFATLYHGGKLRSNFSFDELHRFLESSVLAVAAGERRKEPIFLALQAFAALGSAIIKSEHAVDLEAQAWWAPGRSWHVVDLCLNGLWVAAPFDAPGELLRDRAAEAVKEYPGHYMFHFRLARGHSVCGDHEAAWASIREALRLLPAVGTRSSHKELQEQFVRERDNIQEDLRRARVEAEREREWAQRMADHEQRAGALEGGLREVRDTMDNATSRSVQTVTFFAVAITFAMGSLQITLQSGLELGDRALSMALLGSGLVVFALVIVGGTAWADRIRRG